MKIAVFSPDVPYPPNSGGKADIWRRILAFRHLGHEVMLINLHEPSGPDAPSPLSLSHVDSVVKCRYSFPIKRGPMITMRQLLNCWKVPWHAANRVPDAAEMQELSSTISKFHPDVLWLDGPWFGVAGSVLAKQLNVPMLYRSHNIEHQYLMSQARAAVSFRDRVAWTLVCVGLKRFEIDVMRQCIAVFDISVDDLKYWEEAGLKHLHWLPPLPELAFMASPVDAIPGDVVFLGNLGTPNNVRGVEWLVTEVWPRVRAKLPDTRCRIVGSHPTPVVSRLLANAVGIELSANVPDPTPYLFGAKVLVNPVSTGSGVQVKMLDMLMTDAPIVTSSQGARGLPHEIRQLFRIADDPDRFAQAIVEELTSPKVDVTARATAREMFSVPAIGHALELATQIYRPMHPMDSGADPSMSRVTRSTAID